MNSNKSRKNAKTGNRPSLNNKNGGGKPQGSRAVTGRVAAPIAYSSQKSTTAPKVVANRNSRRIVHRELVGSVAGSVAFSAVGYDCNPGLASTFPWLSVQAAQYEQYTFHKLKFHFVTRTATTTVGSLLMAPDYDPSDAAPVSESAMSAYQDCTEDVPWRDQMCTLKKNSMFPTGPRKFIRAAAVAGDIKLFDAARFFTGVVDEIGTTALGKLWVDYDVEFFVPQTSIPTPAATQSSLYDLTDPVAYVTATPTILQFDNAQADALRWGNGTAGVYTPPAGAYVVRAFGSYTDSAAEPFKAKMQMQKNGSNIATGREGLGSNQTATGVGVNGIISVDAEAYIVMNGTDTFDVTIELTGAAGTLSNVVQSVAMVVRMA